MKDKKNIGKELFLNLLEMTCEDLTGFLGKRFGKGEFHARALIREVVKDGNLNFSQAEAFIRSPRLAKELAEIVVLPRIEIENRVAEEETLKFSIRLEDGLAIESVVIPMRQYNTLCVSTQAGCRMNCHFCETARGGFHRNLKVAEITGQLFAARFILKKKISNIVFMGMGEPLDNVDNLIRAIRIFNDQQGFDISHRHMTVSTCGLVPGIKALSRAGFPRLNLAVSINAPDNKTRSRLMPVNRRYPLEDLMAALKEFPLGKRRVIFVEYILIHGVNDSDQYAEKLADLLSPLKTRVNLIAYNPGQKAMFKTPEEADLHRFSRVLENRGLFVVKRWSKGSKVMAGCGQLAGGLPTPDPAFI